MTIACKAARRRTNKARHGDKLDSRVEIDEDLIVNTHTHTHWAEGGLEASRAGREAAGHGLGEQQQQNSFCLMCPPTSRTHTHTTKQMERERERAAAGVLQAGAGLAAAACATSEAEFSPGVSLAMAMAIHDC